MKIESFFVNKRDVVLFLLCVIVFASLFIVIYHPIVPEGVSPEMWGSMTEGRYLFYLVGSGYALLGISRIYFYYHYKSRKVSLLSYLLWILVEVLVISLLLSRISYHLRPMGSLTYPRLLILVFFDVVSVLLIPYIMATLIIVLRHQSRRIEYLTELNSMQELTIQEAVKDDVDEVLAFSDKGGRFAFSTRSSNVLYIESADNYCNIQYENDGKIDYFILHNSMKNVSQTYAGKGFVRCHRCYLVNSKRIKALKKTRDGLVLEIVGTENTIPVSKTYAADVMGIVGGQSKSE